jgi:hypothetical protein
MNIGLKTAASAAATGGIGMIAVTPLCGLLFACGCSWPWSGFFFDCNYFHPNAEYRCPWYASPLAGGLSVGLSVVLGMIASGLSISTLTRRHRWEHLIRVGTGTVVFFCTAILSGWLAAHSQHYPLGPVAVLSCRLDVSLRH